MLCRHTRRLLHRSRDALSPAEQLALETHLERCARCAAEVDVIEGIRDAVDGAPARPLGPQRIARALDRAFETASTGVSERAAVPRRRAWIAASAAVPIAAAALLWWWPDAAGPTRTASVAPSPPAADRVVRGEVRADGRSLANGAPIPSDVSVVAPGNAVLALGPARVELGPRTAIAWDRGRSALRVDAGRARVAVAAEPPHHFVVITRSFRVEVAGARFEATPERVAVVSGELRVLTPDGGTVIAELRDGESWSAAPPAESGPAAATAGAVPDAGPGPDPATHLARARRALADGDVAEARDAVRAALSGRPARARAAEARTILAECAQSAGDPDEAVRLYLDVARRYPDLRAGETALFAAARLEANRGRADEARGLLRRYLRAYADGSFAADARARLRALGDDTDR